MKYEYHTLLFPKRAMAQDIIKVMKNLGHNKFFVGAHDASRA